VRLNGHAIALPLTTLAPVMYADLAAHRRAALEEMRELGRTHNELSEAFRAIFTPEQRKM
jgi:hypothetical protein